MISAENSYQKRRKDQAKKTQDPIIVADSSGFRKDRRSATPDAPFGKNRGGLLGWLSK